MSSQNLRDRTTQLANGAEVPLSKAILYYGLLISHAASGESELLYTLRQASLGKELTAEQRTQLNDEKYLVPDKVTVDPILKQVVLAAIRGEENSLHLDSPFVTHLDRSLFEYEHSREVIRTQVDDEVAVERFLKNDPVQKRIPVWKERLKSDNSSEGLPPL